jgi:hypothetical protein
MKNMIRFSGMVVCLFALAGVLGTQADPAKTMKWSIPFDFMVGDAQMPAGEYIVQFVYSLNSRHMMKIRNTDGKQAAFFLANPALGNFEGNNPQLVFNRYEDQYFLSKVSDKPGSGWMCFAKTNREKEAAQRAKMASVKSPKTVAVLAQITN